MSVDSLAPDVVPSADGVPSGSFGGLALSVSVEAAHSGVYALLFDVRLVCLPCEIRLGCTMSEWRISLQEWRELRREFPISASLGACRLARFVRDPLRWLSEVQTRSGSIRVAGSS